MAKDSILITAAAVYLFAISLIISTIDYRRLIIPNFLNAAYACGALIFVLLLDEASVLPSLVGGGLGFATLLAFKLAYRSIRGYDGLGFGDVKFMVGAGLWVGWQGLAPLIFVSSSTALLFVLGRGVLAGPLDLRENLPFGPFLCVGTIAIWSVQVAGLAPWVGLP